MWIDSAPGDAAPEQADVVRAADAAAGVSAARGETFDAVWLDGAAPGAVELVARLASADGGRQAVVALTEDAETAAAMLQAGALDAIPRGDAESRALRYALAQHELRAELQAARAEAEAQRLAFERLNRQTTLILSVLAHDLRSPSRCCSA